MAYLLLNAYPDPGSKFYGFSEEKIGEIGVKVSKSKFEIKTHIKKNLSIFISVLSADKLNLVNFISFCLHFKITQWLKVKFLIRLLAI